MSVTDVSFSSWMNTWIDQNIGDIERKSLEYGSNSLAALGRLFLREPNIPAKQALEVGALIYGFGKMERVGDALMRGRLPSTDTVHDTAVYCLMALYIRHVGRWP